MSPPPEQYAVDELLRAFMQRVEIDEQVIIYLEMTQVGGGCEPCGWRGGGTHRSPRGRRWRGWGVSVVGCVCPGGDMTLPCTALPTVPQRPAAGRMVPALHLHQLQQRLPPLPPGDEVHVPRYGAGGMRAGTRDAVGVP